MGWWWTAKPSYPAIASLLTQVDRIEAKLDQLLAQQGAQMGAIDDLNAAVTAETTVEGSAITLVNGFVAELSAAMANGNMAAVSAAVTRISANAAALAAAVAANTPAVTSPAPVTPPPAPVTPPPAPAPPAAPVF